jgi:hypothetical protein
VRARVREVCSACVSVRMHLYGVKCVSVFGEGCVRVSVEITVSAMFLLLCYICRTLYSRGQGSTVQYRTTEEDSTVQYSTEHTEITTNMSYTLHYVPKNSGFSGNCGLRNLIWFQV